MKALFIALAAIFISVSSFDRARGQSEDELIAGAKKEGKVTFWSGMALDDSRLVAAGFEKKYPFVKVDIFRAGGEQIVNRAIAEAGAAQNSSDVLNAFALKVLQERGFLAPYNAPEAAHYPAAYKDPKHFWVSMKNNYNVIGYNSRLVTPQDAPKNWQDLLNPRWKDKLGMDDEEYFWYAGMLKYWGEAKGKKYMEALAKQGIQWRNGHNLLVELMGAGEYPVSVVIYPERAEQLKAKGQTVEWVKTTDPILVNMDMMGVAAKAPHPNAARLFFNYVLSKEGQMILHSRFRLSARTDIPPLTPDMEPKKLPLVPLDPAIPTNPKVVQEFRAVFGLK
jgi:iron(III) transport system substrate-binding protein